MQYRISRDLSRPTPSRVSLPAAVPIAVRLIAILQAYPIPRLCLFFPATTRQNTALLLFIYRLSDAGELPRRRRSSLKNTEIRNVLSTLVCRSNQDWLIEPRRHRVAAPAPIMPPPLALDKPLPASDAGTRSTQKYSGLECRADLPSNGVCAWHVALHASDTAATAHAP